VAWKKRTILRSIFVVLVALPLGACNYRLDLSERGGPGTGNGTAVSDGWLLADLTINIGNRKYTGTWVLVEQGGGVAIINQNIVQGGVFGQAFGVATISSDSYVGKAVLRAGDGTGLNCDIQMSSETGIGVCHTDDGKIYDLQIRLAG
jgi:hypothetical protein